MILRMDKGFCTGIICECTTKIGDSNIMGSENEDAHQGVPNTKKQLHSAPSNCPLRYPEYHVMETIRPLLEVLGGLLVVAPIKAAQGCRRPYRRASIPAELAAGTKPAMGRPKRPRKRYLVHSIRFKVYSMQ